MYIENNLGDKIPHWPTPLNSITQTDVTLSHVMCSYCLQYRRLINIIIETDVSAISYIKSNDQLVDKTLVRQENNYKLNYCTVSNTYLQI